MPRRTMAKLFEHFILTIFNVQIGWKTFGNKKLGRPTNAWMWHRMDLFDRYCFSSILGQTNQNFKWIVLFDEDTKPCFRKIIAKYKKIMPNFCPHFVKGKFRHGHKFNKFIDIIKSELPKERKFLMTTRLDCDDACHKDFIDIIQKNFRSKEEFIAPTHGYLFLEEELRFKAYISKRWQYPRFYTI